MAFLLVGDHQGRTYRCAIARSLTIQCLVVKDVAPFAQALLHSLLYPGYKIRQCLDSRNHRPDTRVRTILHQALLVVLHSITKYFIYAL
jgi:hypothetical protein